VSGNKEPFAWDRSERVRPQPRRWLAVCLLGLTCASLMAGPGWADPMPGGAAPLPPVLTLDAAVSWALENNPELAALRQQHGIAAAAVVIARTYPFNPLLEARVQGVSGPDSAGIDNRVNNEIKLFLELEVRGQGKHRRAEALAALSAADWEIATQELSLIVRVVRAFRAVLYQKERLQLLEETVRLDERVVEQAQRLLDAGKLRGADLLFARTEVEEAKGLLGPARTALVATEYELGRALGVVGAPPPPEGKLEVAAPDRPAAELTEDALRQRPDLHTRQAAVAKAEASLRLTIANRFGNPTVGAAYQYDPARINLIGGQVNLPIPVFNLHRGEIQQREAEKARAILELRQAEILIQQEVQSAHDRLAAARAAADAYRSRALPELRAAVEDIEKLFAQGEPGVDVLRIIDLRRKLLRARENYLSAQWEISQAQVDLVAAVADPCLVLPAQQGPTAPAQPARITLEPLETAP
jgi:outer membrane protein TolC